MALPELLSAVDKGRVFIAPASTGSVLPIAYTFSVSGAVAAGAGSISLALATVAGAAATVSDSVELETGQPILFPSNTSTVLVAGTPSIGSHKLIVDDGAGAVPANLIAIGNFLKFPSDDQLYLVVARRTLTNGYEIRVNPELKAAPADNAQLVIYNRVKLALPGDQQFIDITSTAQAVNVTGVTYAMADAAASLTTFAYKQLLGITEITPTPGVETVEVSNMLFSTELPSDFTFEIGVTGQKVLGDAARREELMPVALNQRTNKALYALYESLDGDLVEGPANITDGGITSPKGEVEEYNFTLGITLGENFKTNIR